MIVGGYTLDLYCDHPNHERVVGMSAGAPFQFTGQTGPGCRRQARRCGWILKRSGDAICPVCSKRRVA